MRGKGLRQGRALAALAVLAALAALTACGSSRTSRSPSASGSTATTGASAGAASTKVAAVAFVAGKPIATSSYEHWLSVERALGVTAGAGHRALGFLITSAWLRDEASARGVAVSEAEVRQRLSQLERKSFPKAASLSAYLARSHQSEADLRSRVQIEMLQARIAGELSAGKSAAQQKAVLASYERVFQRRWKARTMCAAAYLMEDCSEYRGKPESQATVGSSAGAAASTSPQHKVSGGYGAPPTTASSSHAGGEVQSPPGAMVITSPVIEDNGSIPAEYTCDGANLSLPLQWERVPAHAAALVLFVIDDSSSGPASGIRWVVGDIDPASKGVAAGATPEGGIVGSDTQGKPGYGGICPEPGKTSTIELVLYALRKKIPLSPGFSPQVAESEYGAGNDLLGSAAVTYATYHRPQS
jgi:phosphatidylethanolamine-binding protein (PEBP) family uncharacterized protein